MVSIRSMSKRTDEIKRICPKCNKPLTGNITFYFKDGLPSSKEIVYCQNCGYKGEI